MTEGLDLNLLAALDVLLEERSVTSAAARLHLSVPATSRVLSRLRVALDDPLLVRAGRGLVPTPHALALQPRLHLLIEDARTLTLDGTRFSPDTLHRTFAVRASDAAVIAIAPAAIARAREQAPGVVLRFIPEGEEDARQLREGQVDLELGIVKQGAADIVVEEIGATDEAGVVHATHELCHGVVTAERLAAADHVVASRRGRLEGPIDRALAELGLKRRVVATVGTIGAAVALAATSDVVAAIPASVGNVIGPALGLTVLKLPLELPPLTYSIAWHRRHEHDPAHIWLRHLIGNSMLDALNAET